MFNPTFLDTIRNASIADVVASFITLKPKGKDLVASCPFHDEKTASFTINKVNNIYKCFGCGKGGDVINFVQDYKHYTFSEAVEYIANVLNIVVVYDKDFNNAEYKIQKNKNDLATAALFFAITTYHAQLVELTNEHPVQQYLQGRGFNRDTQIKFKLGYAPAGNNLVREYTNQNTLKYAIDASVCGKSAKENYYDRYQESIIIPIYNKSEKPVSLGGRYIGDNKENAKYINGENNNLYNKSKNLFALNNAINTIVKTKQVYIVEGYLCTIQMHNYGYTNTVATNGTGWTIEQLNLLTPYADEFFIIYDSDTAGQKATLTICTQLIKMGKAVYYAHWENVEQKQDPDSYLLANDGTLPDLVDFVISHAQHLIDTAQNNIAKISKAHQQIAELICLIPNQIVRENYTQLISKKHQIAKQSFKKFIEKSAISDDETLDTEQVETFLSKAPEWINKEEFLDLGYCKVDTKNRIGYYGFGNNGQVEITNFIIKPLFHEYAGPDSSYLIEIKSLLRHDVLRIKASQFASKEMFQKILFGEGGYVILGSSVQLLRIASNIIDASERCYTIKNLGWHNKGFYAFANKVWYKGKILNYSEYGVINIENENYLAPVACKAYDGLSGLSTDSFEKERQFKLINSKYDLATWAKQIHIVYGNQGLTAIAYTVLSVFRDFIYNIGHSCPHLYGFGERSSGKSMWAESITAVFFQGKKPFGLNSGTDSSFAEYMSQFSNTPAHLNEFDIKSIKPEWFQMIKSAFDGEGRNRIKMSVDGDRKIETQNINSTIILTGQYLVTEDDNSIVSRSIIESFTEKEHTQQEKEQFDILKDQMEKKGLSNIIIEILNQRHIFEEYYRECFDTFLYKWRTELQGDVINSRILQNWCFLFSCYYTIFDQETKIQPPVSREEFEQYCKQKVVHWSSQLRSSDMLSEFWSAINYMVDAGLITNKWDYVIQEEANIKLRNNTTKEYYTHTFKEPTKVLYLRLNSIHKLYQELARKQTGKNGMSIDNLLHYFTGRNYYLGSISSKKFVRYINHSEDFEKQDLVGNIEIESKFKRKKETTVTNAYAFIYSQLPLDIYRENK